MKDVAVINRIWAMPNRWTFTIKPIKELLNREMDLPEQWVDPFAGMNSPAGLTNDLDPEMPTKYHLDALDFLRMFPSNSVKGVLFDPPYSPRQVSESYKKLGRTVNMQTTQSSYWSNLKNEVARVLGPDGKAICCGWNSMGLGLNRGFAMTKILLVPHGGNKNDTIVTVETRRGQN